MPSKTATTRDAEPVLDRRLVARNLRLERVPCRLIAEQLGVSRSTVHAWTRDLTPAARRRRRWDQATLVAWCQTFALEHGRPPVAREVTPPPPGSGWPSVSAVIAEMGSWNALITAAGFPARAQGYSAAIARVA